MPTLAAAGAPPAAGTGALAQLPKRPGRSLPVAILASRGTLASAAVQEPLDGKRRQASQPSSLAYLPTTARSTMSKAARRRRSAHATRSALPASSHSRSRRSPRPAPSSSHPTVILPSFAMRLSRGVAPAVTAAYPANHDVRGRPRDEPRRRAPRRTVAIRCGSPSRSPARLTAAATGRAPPSGRRRTGLAAIRSPARRTSAATRNLFP
jgi:hypothetical protein